MKKKIGIQFIPCIVLMAVLLLCMALTAGKVSASDFSDGTAEEGKYIEEDQDNEILQNPDIVDFKINNENILGYANVLEISFEIANIDVSKYGYYVGCIEYSYNEHLISIPMYIALNGVIFGRTSLDASHAEGIYKFKGFYPSYFDGNVIIKNKDVTNSKFIFCNNCHNDIHRIEEFAYKAPTCTQDGNTEMKMCKICKTIFEGHVLSATGHTWSTEYTIENNATCTEPGIKDIRCIKCGEIKQDSIQKIPATGHTIVIDKAIAPTCEEAGKTEGSHCNVCGEILKSQEEIPAIGHTMILEKIISQPTVFTAEKKEYKCSICGLKKIYSGNILKPIIKTSASKITMNPRQKITTLKATYANGDKVTSWKSSNNKIFKVTGKSSGSCVIISINPGKAYLSISLQSGLTKKISVTVKPAKTQKIYGVKKNITIKKGKKYTLKPKISPSYSSDKIIYYSNNKKVVAVNSKGLLIARKKGTAYITIKSGSKYVKCKVTIK